MKTRLPASRRGLLPIASSDEEPLPTKSCGGEPVAWFVLSHAPRTNRGTAGHDGGPSVPRPLRSAFRPLLRASGSAGVRLRRSAGHLLFRTYHPLPGTNHIMPGTDGAIAAVFTDAAVFTAAAILAVAAFG